jgi:hypothetical protein
MSFVVSVAATIAHLVAVEVFRGTMPPVTRLLAMMRILTVVAVIRAVVIVNVAIEMFRAVKPWTSTNKDPV